MTILIQELEEVMFLQFDSELMATFASHEAKHVNKASFLKVVQRTDFQNKKEFCRNILRLCALSIVKKKLFYEN